MSDMDKQMNIRFVESSMAGALFLTLYLVLALAPALIAYLAHPSLPGEFSRQVARNAALTAFAVLVLQSALAARLRILDAPFGFDILMLFHKGMGLFALGILVVAHVGLLSVEVSPVTLFLAADVPWPIYLGRAALLLIVVTALAMLYYGRVKADYIAARALHANLGIVIVALAFFHSVEIGSDLVSGAPRWMWMGLFALAVLVYGYRKVYVPFWGKRRFNVVEVKKENKNVHTLLFEPDDGEVFWYRPGQFWFIKLVRRGRWSEEHHFTISSSPTQQGVLTSTIKESGDFTATIGETRPGEYALAEGPYGRFSFMFHHPRRMVFLAGGIGITPIMSMLRYLRDTSDERPALLLNANRAEEDIVFREELDALPDHMKVVHVLEKPSEGWAGPSGFVNREIIEKYAGEGIKDADIYLCGPPPMIDAVEKALAGLGIEDDKIHYERFSL